MRARYAAYTQHNIDYVEKTHDPASPHDFNREQAEAWAKSSTWQGLEIVETVAGGADDETGVVEFIARYVFDGKPQAHHERSDFVRRDGRWYFVDGELVKPRPIVRTTPKIGRNDPCSCGSGKKFKKCCGA
jgi:SEC-C motif domain protein